MRSLSLFFALVFSLAGGMAFSATPPASGPTPDQALQKLIDGNQHYLSTQKDNPQKGEGRRKELAKGQAPFAVILSCSDSRVPPEHIFDQGLGDLFVVRVAGNVVDTMGLGSIEYATQVLGSPLIMVLGHSQCGAVDAAIQGKPVPGHIQDLADHIRADLKGASCPKDDKQLSCSITANVNFIVDQIKNSEPVLAPLVKAGKLKVVGARYDLETGKVEMLTK